MVLISEYMWGIYNNDKRGRAICYSPAMCSYFTNNPQIIRIYGIWTLWFMIGLPTLKGLNLYFCQNDSFNLMYFWLHLSCYDGWVMIYTFIFIVFLSQFKNGNFTPCHTFQNYLFSISKIAPLILLISVTQT